MIHSEGRSNDQKTCTEVGEPAELVLFNWSI